MIVLSVSGSSSTMLLLLLLLRAACCLLGAWGLSVVLELLGAAAAFGAELSAFLVEVEEDEEVVELAVVVVVVAAALLELLLLAGVLAALVTLFSGFSSVFLTAFSAEELKLDVVDEAAAVAGFLAEPAWELTAETPNFTVGAPAVGLLVELAVALLVDGLLDLAPLELPLELLDDDDEETDECLATGAGTGAALELLLLTEFFRFDDSQDSS